MVLAKIAAQHQVLETMGAGHLRVAVVGNVDAGKSTLIGTIKTSTLDDGRGRSRSKIMKHKHEKDTGRTSTISQHAIGFDENGKVLESCSGLAEIALKSTRVVSLMDLAGHEKYFKSTVAGMSMGMADYALLLVNASQPPTHMTMHHLRLCTACGIPAIVLITKVDVCPSKVLSDTKQEIAAMIRDPEFGKRQYAVKSDRDIQTVKDKLDSLTPIVTVSCVTGEGLCLLKQLLFALQKRRLHEKKMKRPFEVLVDDVFNVKGVGSVISGFVNAGIYRLGDPLFVGPIKDGTYAKTNVRSIHIAQTETDRAFAGHSACFALSGLAKYQLQYLCKGLVALTKVPNPSTVKFFKAEIVMLRGEPVTATKGTYHTSAHILHLKKAVKLIDIEESVPVGGGFTFVRGDSALVLRPGDQARATFKFLNGAQYVRKGMRLILRDGSVRAIGVITETGNAE